MQLWQQKARLERERAKAAATKAWAAEEKAVAKLTGEVEGARKALASAAKALEEAKRSTVRWGAAGGRLVLVYCEVCRWCAGALSSELLTAAGNRVLWSVELGSALGL